jgi:murein DD-endopeptidase MepM/ murein hydrolase activator NlpD
MAGMRLRVADTAKERLAQAAALVALIVGPAALAAPVVYHPDRPALLGPVAQAAARAAAPSVEQLVWDGADVDGDGAADFANPTGEGVRGHDAYGDGAFGARRDGGSRRHEGVDFMAQAGQPVEAPISGFVSKIGYAYEGDSQLKYVEITNPALHYSARVFYVDPSVDVGAAVAVGSVIGRHHTLERKYPGGMTDHVHLELRDGRGRPLDARHVITARLERVDVAQAD